MTPEFEEVGEDWEKEASELVSTMKRMKERSPMEFRDKMGVDLDENDMWIPFECITLDRKSKKSVERPTG